MIYMSKYVVAIVSILALILLQSFAIAQDSSLFFREGNISILRPVKLLKTPQGYLRVGAMTDGGTHIITIIDGTGKQFRVFIYHKYGRQKEWNTIYLNAYPGPGDKDSVKIKDQKGFKDALKPLLDIDQYMKESLDPF